jgi:serine-type D-Ala-D-Ala carboxypeptidase/endopeptidase (penicillin-binding protein 4)
MCSTVFRRISAGAVCLAAFFALCAPASALSEGGLRARLGAALGPAGGASGAYVLDLSTRRSLWARRPDKRLIPASVNKLGTTATALERYGPDGTIPTTVQGTGTLGDDGVYRGTLYLRGEGDPTFGSDSFTRSAYGGGGTTGDLARRLDRLGVKRVRGRILGDESFFDSRRGVPDSGYATSIYIGPLSAVDWNRGLGAGGFQRRPPLYAAARLVDALRAQGIPVSGSPGVGKAPDGAEILAETSSLPMSRIISLTNHPSDNFLAEMLLKGLGGHFGSEGSTAAGAAVVRSQLAQWGARPTIVDGSGLGRGNRTTARNVVRILDGMAASPNAKAFRDSLPVAGRSGTLAGRMNGTIAQDRCQAKTGTLSNVSALAGYCRTVNGHTVAFAVIMNRVSVSGARSLQNRMAISVAASRPAGAAKRIATRPAPQTTSGAPATPGGGLTAP